MYTEAYSVSPLGNEDSSEEGSGSPGQHSSSDPGSDLDELLTKDFPTADLPSLLSRAMGKGEYTPSCCNKKLK